MAFGLVLLTSACAWAQFKVDGANRYNPNEIAIGPANVGDLEVDWAAQTVSVVSSPVVYGGRVYIGTNDRYLKVYDALGKENCGGQPEICFPLWTSTRMGSYNYATPAVDTYNGVVYQANYDGTLYAFDADGVQGCSGVPLVCEPLWTASLDGEVVTSNPVVWDGVVYVGATSLHAFDAAGAVNCTGSPKVCEPLWTAASLDGLYGPAVSGGLVYAGLFGDDKVAAYDAAGVLNCSGSPKVCEPIWSATVASPSAAPTVSDGILYQTSRDDAAVYAFDAAGITNCSGSPALCQPLWSGTTGYTERSSPAVAEGVLYVGGWLGDEPGALHAFDAAGSTNCSGSPKVCEPMWSGIVGGDLTSPAVANGVVYAGSGNTDIVAFDAAGVAGCGGSPKTCDPLWRANLVSHITDSPSVVLGRVYVGTDAGTFYAFGLPTS